MVRAIFIDPVERNVSVARVPDVWRDIRMKYGAKLVRVAVIPCGDAVYVAEGNKDSAEAFRLGRSAVFGGWATVFGLVDRRVIQSPQADARRREAVCLRRRYSE